MFKLSWQMSHNSHVTYGVNGNNDLDCHFLTSINSGTRRRRTEKPGLGSSEEGGEDNEEHVASVSLGCQGSFV